MIDLWDTCTYDEEMLDSLESHKEIIDGYFDLARKKDAMVAKLPTWEPIQPNRFTGDYMAAVEGLGQIKSTKTLRAFHYTRMTEGELEILQAQGIVPTSMKQRVNRQVAAGRLTEEQGHRIVTPAPCLSATGV